MAECECKGFQFQGLLCPHAIAVMRHVEMEPFLPAHYVLKRWMRNANSSAKRPTGLEVNESDLESIMLAALTREMEKVAIKAVKYRPAYDIACTRVRELDAEVTAITAFVIPKSANATAITGSTCGARKSLQYHDPPISQCKGKRNPHRFKPPSELGDVKKMRTCGYCHKKKGHNMKTCPQRLADEKGKRRQIDDSEAENDENCTSETE